MKRYNKWVFVSAVLICFLWAGLAAGYAAAQEDKPAPLVGVTTKSATAVGYEVGAGATKVDMKGTDLMPGATGEAKVEIKKGTGKTSVQVDVKGLMPPGKLGAEFLTYVLWVVTTEGRTGNTGELVIDKNGDAKLSATTPAQTFSLIVTAEPYFAVRLPSEMVVMQSEIRKDTKGKIFPISQYQLMKRQEYQKLGNPLALAPDLKHVPLEMYEARNAVEIAKSHGAERYAPEAYAKADASLKMAEQALASTPVDKNAVISTAKQTAQFAEDARALAVQREEAERIKNERDAAAAAAAAKAKAEADAKAAVVAAQAAEAAAEAKQKADEEAKRQAELAAAREDVLKAKEQAARDAAEQARKAAQDLRAQLLAQLNHVLDTQDTPRGLVVNMADVLFATGKYDLVPDAQIKLAKLSGIILSHPGLNLAIEGYTDSTGSSEFNQKLSQQRADAVRSYLIAQGLADNTITAAGFGPANPVDDNSTAAGRKKNRRVEIIVSGEVIGQKVGK